MRTERGLAMDGGSCSSSSYVDGLSNGNGYATIPTTSSSSSPSPSPLSSGYIEHRVSKMDTLAGVAIKYGVEVADIRRMNGLVTDLQMFAHKSLQIPPGRHPPSPVVGSNCSASNGEQTPPRRPHDDVLGSLQSLKLKPPHKVSPAMSTLQGYYGLTVTPPKTGTANEGTEMVVYNTGRVLCMEDGLLSRESPASDPGLSRHRKSRSLVSLETGDLFAAVVEAGDGSEADKSTRRRQKVEVDTSARTPEILLKEDSGGGFSGRTGKGLALRSKIGIRTDVDAGRQNPIPVADSFMSDGSDLVRKSSSTSNLVDSESSSSIWPTSKWSDAIARPIFDGLPKPTTGRRKTALD